VSDDDPFILLEMLVACPSPAFPSSIHYPDKISEKDDMLKLDADAAVLVK
jgi:hypothetical protein